MGKIQVVAVNVEGDDTAIAEALKMATNFLNRSDGNADPEPPGGPRAVTAALAASAQARSHDPGPSERVECPRCGEPQKNRYALAVHSRFRHPKSKKAKEASHGKAASGKEFFCPVKNCVKSFKLRGWRDKHVKRDHGIEESI
jgi:hypothetical protein